MPVRRLLIFSLLIGECVASAPRDLSELVVEDSLYVDPNTELPYSGPVFRAFADDSLRIQLEGELLNGTWEGELLVYHRNGRVRYMGSFANGERCGPWTENADSVRRRLRRLRSRGRKHGSLPPLRSERLVDCN